MNALPYIDAFLEAEAENAALRRFVACLVAELARSRALSAETRELVAARFPDTKGGARDAA